MTSSKKILTLPANHTHEIAVLAAMMNDEKALNHSIDCLSYDCFDHKPHRIIFSAMHEMNKLKATINSEMLGEHLTKSSQLQDVGGMKNVLLLGMSYSLSCDYAYYCEELVQLTQRRKSILLAKQFLDAVSETKESPEPIFNAFIEDICNLMSPAKSNIKNSQELASNYFNGKTLEEYREWKKQLNKDGLPAFIGLPTGYYRLDLAIGGLQDGKLYYCGARTSMGKTTFMMNIINNIFSKTDKKAGVISLEMNSSDIFGRLLCINAGVSFKAFDEGRLYQTDEILFEASVKFFCDNKEKFLIESPASLTIEKLCAKARRLKEFFGINILFVDYLTRLTAERKFPSKHLEIDYISKSLQNLARQLNIPVFVLAQLNRASTHNENQVPGLTDFRESGSIEEDADACLLLHRPDYYNPDKEKGLVEVHIAKNRLLGVRGKVELKCECRSSERYIENPQKAIISKPKAYKDE